MSNKSSGDFGVHTTHEVIVERISHEDDDTVELNVSRVYSHENSDGERLANVNYIMDVETYEIIDFEQVSDEAY